MSRGVPMSEAPPEHERRVLSEDGIVHQAWDAHSTVCETRGDDYRPVLVRAVGTDVTDSTDEWMVLGPGNVTCLACLALQPTEGQYWTREPRVPRDDELGEPYWWRRRDK